MFVNYSFAIGRPVDEKRQLTMVRGSSGAGKSFFLNQLVRSFLSDAVAMEMFLTGNLNMADDDLPQLCRDAIVKGLGSSMPAEVYLRVWFLNSLVASMFLPTSDLYVTTMTTNNTYCINERQPRRGRVGEVRQLIIRTVSTSANQDEVELVAPNRRTSQTIHEEGIQLRDGPAPFAKYFVHSCCSNIWQTVRSVLDIDHVAACPTRFAFRSARPLMKLVEAGVQLL
ncbi:hypothetical protein BC832DRAFT_226305 [Gaertneriomyces semiglobifer]|nr:hypothetical protein BC832DRAFT_226305 [Gaertneriomyces semiglobifer]